MQVEAAVVVAAVALPALARRPHLPARYSTECNNTNTNISINPSTTRLSFLTSHSSSITRIS
jgi:hypothetical protein